MKRSIRVIEVIGDDEWVDSILKMSWLKPCNDKTLGGRNMIRELVRTVERVNLPAVEAKE